MTCYAFIESYTKQKLEEMDLEDANRFTNTIVLYWFCD